MVNFHPHSFIFDNLDKSYMNYESETRVNASYTYKAWTPSLCTVYLVYGIYIPGVGGTTPGCKDEYETECPLTVEKEKKSYV
ncbi:predicted protein [Plenodomus lingam JN3]|uniref:Predicted protein n=1 Tax=Leptosphaeria maculans (strain JN3 / isolate v23.1.3 / race Av1-4-5-6-7-8) TaxID=985895 RepID=E4ZNY2_LEPMJ|nr:predicted protein [Plenodomus lingam JN3]CBX93351.1 predicted protein [Plenodomus lingam JN3]